MFKFIKKMLGIDQKENLAVPDTSLAPYKVESPESIPPQLVEPPKPALTKSKAPPKLKVVSPPASIAKNKSAGYQQSSKTKATPLVPAKIKPLTNKPTQPVKPAYVPKVRKQK